MFELPNYANTLLLIACNSLIGILMAQFQDLKKEIRDTRKKLDDHVENFNIHYSARNHSQHA